MEIMPRPRPPHLHRETTRHGKTVWYVRADKGRRIRINADFGSPEFVSDMYRVLNTGGENHRSPRFTDLVPMLVEQLPARNRLGQSACSR